MSDLSSRELRNQLHSSQYRQLILLLLLHRRKNSLEHQHTRATVESFLEANLLSDLSELEGLEIFWGPKDVSYLVNDPPGKAASKIRHDQPDLERSNNKFFSRNDSTMSKAR